MSTERLRTNEKSPENISKIKKFGAIIALAGITAIAGCSSSNEGQPASDPTAQELINPDTIIDEQSLEELTGVSSLQQAADNYKKLDEAHPMKMKMFYANYPGEIFYANQFETTVMDSYTDGELIKGLQAFVDMKALSEKEMNIHIEQLDIFIKKWDGKLIFSESDWDDIGAITYITPKEELSYLLKNNRYVLGIIKQNEASLVFSNDDDECSEYSHKMSDFGIGGAREVLNCHWDERDMGGLDAYDYYYGHITEFNSVLTRIEGIVNELKEAGFPTAEVTDIEDFYLDMLDGQRKVISSE